MTMTRTRTNRTTRDTRNTAQQLTRAQLRELETELEREQARLERSMSVGAGNDVPSPNGATRVPDSAEGGVAMALATRVHARYQAILDALTRLAAGNYGICVRCGGGIPYGRLIALPEAARCVACGAEA